MKSYHFILMFVLLFSCKKENSNRITIQDSLNKTEQQDSAKKLETPTKEQEIKQLNDTILSILKSKNYIEVAQFIHPEKGLRFSMYATLNDENKTFSKEDFEKYVNSNTKFTWGSKDGTGDPLVHSIRDYLEKWAFKKDFTTGKYSYNTFQGSGNSLNNLEKTYPKAVFTENYISGTEKYSGMDWNSLRLVFEELNGKFYLVAVVNDEWTI